MSSQNSSDESENSSESESENESEAATDTNANSTNTSSNTNTNSSNTTALTPAGASMPRKGLGLTPQARARPPRSARVIKSSSSRRGSLGDAAHSEDGSEYSSSSSSGDDDDDDDRVLGDPEPGVAPEPTPHQYCNPVTPAQFEQERTAATQAALAEACLAQVLQKRAAAQAAARVRCAGWLLLLCTVLVAIDTGTPLFRHRLAWLHATVLGDLPNAVRVGNVPRVRMELKQNPALVGASTDVYNNTLLHIVAGESHHPTMARYSIACTCHSYGGPHSDATVVVVAVVAPSRARLLLRFGANPAAGNVLGDTPLHLAAATSPSLLGTILGAMDAAGLDMDASIANQQGFTPLQNLASLWLAEPELVDVGVDITLFVHSAAAAATLMPHSPLSPPSPPRLHLREHCFNWFEEVAAVT